MVPQNMTHLLWPLDPQQMALIKRWESCIQCIFPVRFAGEFFAILEKAFSIFILFKETRENMVSRKTISDYALKKLL